MATRRRHGGPLRRLLRALAIACLALVAAVVVALVAFRWIDPPTSAFMLRDRAQHLFDETYSFRREWRDYDEIAGHAALAVIAAEDQRFAEHHGFDFKQIEKALADRDNGKRVRGASTISQQVAKNLFLWPGQSWLRKTLEAGITVLIELAWDKRRILEVYLNVAEFGRGTWGIEAASQHCFAKPARKLNRSEAALLAAVLPNPSRLRADAPSSYVRKRQRWIEAQMRALGGTAYLAKL